MYCLETLVKDLISSIVRMIYFIPARDKMELLVEWNTENMFSLLLYKRFSMQNNTSQGRKWQSII